VAVLLVVALLVTAAVDDAVVDDVVFLLLPPQPTTSMLATRTNASTTRGLLEVGLIRSSSAPDAPGCPLFPGRGSETIRQVEAAYTYEIATRAPSASSPPVR
jgi:hypothetical protein